MVNIITECVTAENVASSICPHAAGLSGTSTICLREGTQKSNPQHTRKYKGSALTEVNSFFNKGRNITINASKSEVNKEKITYATHTLPPPMLQT